MREGGPRPTRRQPPRGEQTAAVPGTDGLRLRAVTPDVRADLIDLLASALLADFLGSTDGDGCVPVGK
jgi:hypothetical protein